MLVGLVRLVGRWLWIDSKFREFGEYAGSDGTGFDIIIDIKSRKGQTLYLTSSAQTTSAPPREAEHRNDLLASCKQCIITGVMVLA